MLKNIFLKKYNRYCANSILLVIFTRYTNEVNLVVKEIICS